MTQHTPGPWGLHVNGDDYYGYVGVTPNHSLALVALKMDVMEPHDETCVANARLIAAAPDLLEALKGLTTNMPSEVLPAVRKALQDAEPLSLKQRVLLSELVRRVIEDTRAAITKAEGRS